MCNIFGTSGSRVIRFWHDLIRDYLNAFGDAMQDFRGGKRRSNPKAVLWGAHQRFFLQLCLAIKVNDCVALVQEALDEDCAVVIGRNHPQFYYKIIISMIGLFSTGETTLKGNDEELEDITSAPEAIAQRILESFPTSTR